MTPELHLSDWWLVMVSFFPRSRRSQSSHQGAAEERQPQPEWVLHTPFLHRAEEVRGHAEQRQEVILAQFSLGFRKKKKTFLFSSQIRVTQSICLVTLRESWWCFPVERRRRFNINDRIKELGDLIPKSTDPSVHSHQRQHFFRTKCFCFPKCQRWWEPDMTVSCSVSGCSGRRDGTKGPSWRRRWITSASCRRSSWGSGRWRRGRGSWRTPTTPCCCAYRWGWRLEAALELSCSATAASGWLVFAAGAGAPGSLSRLHHHTAPHAQLFVLSGPPRPALPTAASALLLLLPLLFLLVPGDSVPGPGRTELRGAGWASENLHRLLHWPDVGRGADRAQQPGRHPDGGGRGRRGGRPPAVLWGLEDQQQEEQLQHGWGHLMTWWQRYGAYRPELKIFLFLTLSKLLLICNHGNWVFHHCNPENAYLVSSWQLLIPLVSARYTVLPLFPQKPLFNRCYLGKMLFPVGIPP